MYLQPKSSRAVREVRKSLLFIGQSPACPMTFLPNSPFPKLALVFTCLQYKSFENAMGKGEIAPFPTVFLTVSRTFLSFLSNSKLSSANL